MKIEPIQFKTAEIHPKGWGEEIWLTNNDKYCGKILRFNKGAKFSMHYHWNKTETWYVASGSLSLSYYNLANAEKMTIIITKGSVVEIPCGNPHQLEALEPSEIIEVSTPHEEYDSYRVLPGDSQKK